MPSTSAMRDRRPAGPGRGEDGRGRAERPVSCKNQTFDQERAALLKQAADEVKAERQRLLEAAHKDADLLRAKRQESLRTEQENLEQEIMRRTRNAVFAVTRKTLADLSWDKSWRTHVYHVVQRLRDLNGPAKEQLTVALKSAAGRLACAVRSTCRWSSGRPSPRRERKPVG